MEREPHDDTAQNAHRADDDSESDLRAADYFIEDDGLSDDDGLEADSADLDDD